MIILITGSTDGIGKRTALELANKGHTLFIHGRDEIRVKQVLTELSEMSGNPGHKGITADLSSLDAVARMASRVSTETDTLDVLINNAGVLSKDFKLSHDGLELTFAVNHLAHFYLTNRLLPLIRNSNNGRIINVSSDVHSRELNFQLGKDQNKYDGIREYGVSKLCNILFTYKLARDTRAEVKPDTPIPSTYTLMVTPKQAATIQLAAKVGQLSLSLRSGAGPAKGGEVTYLDTDELFRPDPNPLPYPRSQGYLIVGGKKYLVQNGELIPIGLRRRS